MFGDWSGSYSSVDPLPFLKIVLQMQYVELVISLGREVKFIGFLFYINFSFIGLRGVLCFLSMDKESDS